MQDEILEKYTVAPPKKNERKKKFEIEKNKHLEA